MLETSKEFYTGYLAGLRSRGVQPTPDAGDIVYDPDAEYDNGTVGKAIQSMDAGDVAYDASETYSSDTVGSALSDVKSHISKMDVTYDYKLAWVNTNVTLNESGRLEGRTGFSVTALIPVSGRAYLKGNLWYVPSGRHYVSCYDKDQEFISTLLAGTGGKSTVSDFTQLSLPVNTAYIRISNYTAQISTVELRVYNPVQYPGISDESYPDMAAFGIYPTLKVDPLAYNIDDQVLICDLGKDVTFSSFIVRMTMNNVVATAYTGDFLRFIANDGTTIIKTWGNCKLYTGATYSGEYDLQFSSMTFRYIKIYIYSGSYNKFSSGSFSNFVLIDGDSTYKRITEITDQPPTEVTSSISSGIEKVAYTYAQRPSFALMTDVHQNYNAYKWAMEFMRQRLCSSFLMLGDFNNSSESSLDATKAEILKTAYAISDIDNYAKVLPIRGNHDGVNGAATYTSEMFTSAIIHPFVYTTSANGDYYYDDPAAEIRFIMLNSCADTANRKGFLTESVTFLETALSSVPSGYGVVTSSHHPLVDVDSGEIPSKASDVVDILTAFKAENPDDYICHVCGHMHDDDIDTEDGVVYVRTTASDTLSTYLAIDVFCVDKANKTVNIVRIGTAGEDRSFSY